MVFSALRCRCNNNASSIVPVRFRHGQLGSSLAVVMGQDASNAVSQVRYLRTECHERTQSV